MHSHGPHTDCKEVLKKWMHFASGLKNDLHKPFYVQMSSYFFFFLTQGLSAARRFCLASFGVSFCLALELGNG